MVLMRRVATNLWQHETAMTSAFQHITCPKQWQLWGIVTNITHTPRGASSQLHCISVWYYARRKMKSKPSDGIKPASIMSGIKVNCCCCYPSCGPAYMTSNNDKNIIVVGSCAACVACLSQFASVLRICSTILYDYFLFSFSLLWPKCYEAACCSYTQYAMYFH